MSETLTLARIETLKKRRDFVRLNEGGDKFVTQNFIMLSGPQPEIELMADAARIGYTATKKLGNAVVRNRIKRRLREAARAVAPECAATGRDYVLIARHNACNCEFSSLIRDLRFAFPRIGKVKPLPPPERKPRGKARK